MFLLLFNSFIFLIHWKELLLLFRKDLNTMQENKYFYLYLLFNYYINLK